MENVIVLFEVTVKNGKMEDYLARAGQLKTFLQDAQAQYVEIDRISCLEIRNKIPLEG